jgi:hypothetical protein
MLVGGILDEENAADWIHLAQDRDKWRALENTVMNFQAL